MLPYHKVEESRIYSLLSHVEQAHREREVKALDTVYPELEGERVNNRISIVMITRNRGSQICSALEHLLELPERPQIMVVDNGSTDRTVEIVGRMGASVHLISLPLNLGSAGRNVGVLWAKTPYIAFSDDDSWWAPGALGHAVDLFDSYPKLGLIAARILVGPTERLDPLCQIMASSQLSFDGDGGAHIGIPIVGFAACGAIVRSAAFLEAGGFEAKLGVGGEEQILALDLLRGGWELAYVDEIVAYHYPSPVRDRARRRSREARNALWSAWLRRPAVSALTQTWRIARSSFKDEARRAGFFEAILGLRWTLAARHPVPPSVEEQIKIAERASPRS